MKTKLLKIGLAGAAGPLFLPLFGFDPYWPIVGVCLFIASLGIEG